MSALLLYLFVVLVSLYDIRAECDVEANATLPASVHCDFVCSGSWNRCYKVNARDPACTLQVVNITSETRRFAAMRRDNKVFIDTKEDGDIRLRTR
jgi:hypothetical protein